MYKVITDQIYFLLNLSTMLSSTLTTPLPLFELLLALVKAVSKSRKL